MTTTTTVRFLAPALLLAAIAPLPAQAPKDPPPWWGIQDEDTVSLYWDFSSAANPLVPTTAVLPSWYAPAPGPGMFTNSANITWLPAVSGQQGALGFNGPGTGTIRALVDNDPRPFWIKIFYMQYDSFGVGSSTVLAEVAKDLTKYERGIIAEFSEPLPNGWTRTTVGMYLIPQPIDETVDFTLTETAGAAIAIDNLFVNSKCVKPPPDEKGKALGEIEAVALNLDLNLLTGAACTAVAATEDASNVVTYWVAGRTGANADSLFRLDPTGVPIGPSVPLPTAVASLEGASDLCVANLPTGPLTRRDFVYGVLDRRAANGTVALVAVDSQLAAVVPTRTITLTTPLGPGPLGLAFSPHGDLGAGTFWISDQAGVVTEVNQAGLVLRQLTPGQNGTPLGISGAAYDDKTGQFYWFSQAPLPTPQGISQISGFVHDGYSLQPTGIEWFGDLQLPNPGGQPGGVARGLDLQRRNDGSFRLLCVQQAGPTSHLRVLNGPYQFGWSLLGRCGMQNGPPMEGNAQFQVTLRGVPRAVSAMLFIGFDNTQTGGTALPIPLGTIGLQESRLSIDPALSWQFVPVLSGTAVSGVPMPPPGSGFRGVPVFFQWLVFDPTVQNNMAASQAGETVIY